MRISVCWEPSTGGRLECLLAEKSLKWRLPQFRNIRCFKPGGEGGAMAGLVVCGLGEGGR